MSLQVGEEQLQLQASEVQKLRAEAAVRRRAQREEVESRRDVLQEGLAMARESKQRGQEELLRRRALEMKEERQRRLAKRQQEQQWKSLEMASRLHSLEEETRKWKEQKAQIYQEKQERIQAKEQQKAHEMNGMIRGNL